MKYWKRLQRLREEKKVSQKDVADYLEIGRSTYACYESNNPNVRREPNIEKLIKLSQYFDCSIDYLIGVAENKKSSMNYLIGTKDVSKLTLGDLLEAIELMKKYEKE